jgi:nicotinate phosphoribosyltransferase
MNSPELFSETQSFALLTDLYQLTMACAHWKSGTAEKEAAFHLAFRGAPFHGGYTLACGLAPAIDFVQRFQFSESDLTYLATIPGVDKQPLFPADFLNYLRNLKFTCDIDAVPEGTVIFPHEPLLRVQGPILQAQLLETPLLNFLNFQSLIATKASRVCLAAKSDPVIEFGLRRAQGPDGALSATRAAYVGGCAGTSNVLAGKLYGIPVSGTHAHSWVLAFDNELEAFTAYAKAMPNNCIFLVDTYNTLEGVRRAVEVGKELRQQDHKLVGIRLDSGDLAFLSIEARKILDEAGFPEATIVASNDLDEHIIESLKIQGSKINVWGVGTKLVTAYDQPALGGVYKLSAIRSPSGNWMPKVKFSEQVVKTTNPGILQVRRFRLGNEFSGDAIYDLSRPLPKEFTIVDPLDITRRKHFSSAHEAEDLLVPIFREGRLVYQIPDLKLSRDRSREQLAGFHPGIKRSVNPHQYPAGLELGLHELKTEMILQARTAK